MDWYDNRFCFVTYLLCRIKLWSGKDSNSFRPQESHLGQWAGESTGNNDSQENLSSLFITLRTLPEYKNHWEKGLGSKHQNKGQLMLTSVRNYVKMMHHLMHCHWEGHVPEWTSGWSLHTAWAAPENVLETQIGRPCPDLLGPWLQR